MSWTCMFSLHETQALLNLKPRLTHLVFFNEINDKSFILFKKNNWWVIIIFSSTKSVFYD